ncbi:amino acid ABC transporter permease [Aestuariispira ectoiniformans]|uniref:amino acid ABC transporter permease n=1 Tax=Aestuariispira ectoiniformans TaxID=2775080 RepID=UPI00223AC610|nr:amino acid ABC transporter permease [Aestuariispira ectoiniformans]
MSDFLAVFSQYGGEWGPRLAGAAIVSARISLLGFALAAVAGLLLGLAQASKSRLIRTLAKGYIVFFRGVPVLAILFLIYFGLPGIGVVFNAETAAVLGLGLAFAAQMAEVYRAGFNSIPKGQWEASASVGMSPAQSLFFIILPQVTRIIAAPLIVTFVALLKDSSLASLITVKELVLEGRSLATEFFLPMHIYIWVGAMYFLIAFPLSMAAKYLSRRAQRAGR